MIMMILMMMMKWELMLHLLADQANRRGKRRKSQKYSHIDLCNGDSRVLFVAGIEFSGCHDVRPIFMVTRYILITPIKCHVKNVFRTIISCMYWYFKNPYF
jgi:hypothetical protein